MQSHYKQVRTSSLGKSDSRIGTPLLSRSSLYFLVGLDLRPNSEEPVDPSYQPCTVNVDLVVGFTLCSESPRRKYGNTFLLSWSTCARCDL